MSADTIQARYDELDRIAASFGKASTASAELHKQVTRCVEALEHGGWEGRGANAFFAEMHGKIYPAMQRLARALDEGRSVTLQVKEIMRAAEEEAAGVFAAGHQFAGLGVAGGGGGGGGGGAYGEGDEAREAAARSEFKGEYKIHESELGFKYGIPPGNLGSKSIGGNTHVGPIPVTGMIEGSLGTYEAGVGAGFGKKGFSAGLYGEFYSATAKAEGVIGNEQFGITRDIELKGPGAEGFIGIKDNSIGASIGVSGASLKGETGANIAGANVGVSAEVGLKAEFGFRLGQRTELKLPIFSLGISFGKAKDGKPD